MTHCDAEKAVRDNSYKSLSDDDLREMMLACMSVNGTNQSAIQRFHGFADLINAELASREALDRQGQNSAGLSPGLPVSEETALSTEAVSEPNPWNEGRLNKIIQDKIEECLTVEYKGAPAISREQKKTSEITKDISSMANSAGGLLIYGVAGFQTADKKHLPERLDPVDRLEFTKEWIEHIASQIRPRIAGLRIYPVQLSSGVNHVAYVVEVPEGTTAHQATDFRYYRRYNFESVPMADHEVRDVMARKANPSVTVGARFVLYPRPTKEGHHGAFRAIITNRSSVLARYVGLIFDVPTRFRGKLPHYDSAIIQETGGKSSYRLTYDNNNSAPLFPGGSLSPTFKFRIASHMVPELGPEIEDFRYTVFADSMPMRRGAFTLDQILVTYPNPHKVTV